MNKLYLFLALTLLVACTACGTGSGSNNTGGFGGGGTVGTFTNANLKGNYAYQISGSDVTSGSIVPFRESGVFVADGNGNVTAGEDDFAEANTVISNSHVVATTTGTAYSVSSDGTAVLTLSFSNGGGVQLALSVVSAPAVYLVVNQIAAPVGGLLTVDGTGVAVPQTASAFAVPTGTFVFRMQNVNATSGSATVGAFTVAGGTISGNEDQNTTGSDSQLTLTGAFNAPDTLGRGTGTLTDSNNVVSPFFYYVVDGSHLHLFADSTTGNIGVGRAVAQTGTSLAGSYVFGSDDNYQFGGVNMVGQFTASSGSISGGSFDSVNNGTASLNGTFAASTYLPTANGRVVVNLTPSSGTAIQEIGWVVSPSLVFLISNDLNQEAGTATLQQSGSFTKSSVNGTFGFSMDGFTINTGNTISLYDRAGNMHWDGAGNLGLTEFVNVNGAGQPSGILNGTYTVGTNGRVVGNVTNLSSNLVFYLASGSEAYILQGDTGAEITGYMGQLP
jgi:hypothetical protein